MINTNLQVITSYNINRKSNIINKNTMPKKKINYRDAISEIEETIQAIENEELDVDQLSDKVKRVSELLKICKEKLHNTEKEVENILNEMED